jgi:peptidoglycan/LPS O-acetylase OafA/YrhL
LTTPQRCTITPIGSASSGSTKAIMKYRPEIDGLRAVAVLPVVLSHAGVPGLSGGFLGVDVFFVISGFLITSILLGELRQGTFSWVHFYERRARRILPPLGIMLVLAIPVAWAVMTPSQLKDFGQSIMATAGFAGNIYFWLTKDYWAEAAEVTPLIHLWSLGIEEQFYLVFPPLLALTYRRPRVLQAILGVVMAASLVGMVHARAEGHAAGAFYLLPYRAWELIAGALTAVVTTSRGDGSGSRHWSTWLLLVVLVGSYVSCTPFTHPILLHGVPVLTTALMLMTCRQESAVGRLLALPVLTWIGKISYSLYLFHQPVLAFARLRYGVDLTPLQIVAGLLVTGVLAWASYRLVEQPSRRAASMSTRTLAWSIAIVGCLLVAFGWSARWTDGFWEAKVTRMTPAGRRSLQALRQAARDRQIVWQRLLAEGSRNFLPGTGGRVLFVGDSLSEDLFVAASLAQCEARALQFRRIALDNECIASQSPGRTGVDGVPCETEMMRFRRSALLGDSDCVVIAAAWLETARALPQFLDLPELRGKSVLVYEPHGFTDMRSLIMFMDREGLSPGAERFREYVFFSRHDRTERSNATLRRTATQRSLAEYRGFDCFCDQARGVCDVFDDEGQPLIIDQAHLSLRGAERMGPSLCGAIRDAMQQQAGDP